MTQIFIKELIEKNPNAARGKKNRWPLIALEYIKANPHNTVDEILKGLELVRESSAGGSIIRAIRKMYLDRILERRHHVPYRYTWNPNGWLNNSN